MKKNLKKLCNDLKELREKRGLTQRQVAKKAGVKQQVISRIECGNNVSMLTILRILKVLDGDIKLRRKRK